jgi:hypothetical protein
MQPGVGADARAQVLFGDLIPGHGFWQRKNKGLNPEIPPAVLALQAKLDAEASGQQPGEPPPPTAAPTPTQPSSVIPFDAGAEQAAA